MYVGIYVYICIYILYTTTTYYMYMRMHGVIWYLISYHTSRDPANVVLDGIILPMHMYVCMHMYVYTVGIYTIYYYVYTTCTYYMHVVSCVTCYHIIYDVGIVGISSSTWYMIYYYMLCMYACVCKYVGIYYILYTTTTYYMYILHV